MDADAGDAPPPTKDDLYRLRGEIVSVGSAVEWVISELAVRFGDAEWTLRTGDLWKNVKAYLNRERLAAGLQREIGEVSAFFRPRVDAAHGYLARVQVGDSVQLLRFTKPGGKATPKQVTIADLQADRDSVRRAYDAIRSVAEAMNAHDPSVLRKMGSIARSMLVYP